MASMCSPSKRRDVDVMKLMMSDYKVDLVNDAMSEFFVEFHGPKDSLYEGGVWKVRVELQENYPYRAPSIKFSNRIFHPNIHEESGVVCLDVINQSWSPMFALINIFEIFLPQLLLYPNPTHPLNATAAGLMIKCQEKYVEIVKQHLQKYARPKDVSIQPENQSSDGELSDEDLSSDDELDELARESLRSGITGASTTILQKA